MSEAPASRRCGSNASRRKVGNLLIFPYTLENEGAGEIYAMHALLGVDRATGGARANDTAAVVIAGEEGDAIVGKFAAPLPVDRRIAVPVFPLARRLPAGASFEGRLEMPLPLAEAPLFRRFDLAPISSRRDQGSGVDHWLLGGRGRRPGHSGRGQ